jgi:hypothetical protein
MIAALASVPWPETRLGLTAETIVAGAVYLLAMGFLYQRDLRRMLSGRFAPQL